MIEDDYTQSKEETEIDRLDDEIGKLIFELEEQEEACNKWKKAFNIVMEYSEDLPDCDNEEIEKRLKAIGILQ